MMAGMSKHARSIGSALGAVAGDNPALLGVALIGFSVSFQTISRLATAHRLPGYPVLYPVLIDVGIMAMVIESRRAIDARRSDLAPRVLAWALIGLTLYVNVHGSPPHDWLGRALHIAAPALWAALLELTRWRKLARRRAEDRREGIPLARWIAAPLPALLLWRRMVLRNITSYSLAVELDDARVFARDMLRAHYGRHRWRAQAPALLRSRIRHGRLGDDVTQAAAAAVRRHATGGWEAPVREMVRDALTQGDKLTADVRRDKRQIGETAAAPKQAPKQRQNARQRRASATARKRARAVAILTANPHTPLADVARESGVSERTASRIKSELPVRLHAAGGAR